MDLALKLCMKYGAQEDKPQDQLPKLMPSGKVGRPAA
jgi:hypothetical protein